jgi:hypothetical protein
VVPLDLAHQVVVDVRLPRHLAADQISPLTQTQGTISLSLSLSCRGAILRSQKSCRGRGRTWVYIDGGEDQRRGDARGKRDRHHHSFVPNHPFHL